MTLEIPIRWTSQSLSIQYVTKFYTISIFRFKINFLNSDTIKLFFFAAFAIDTWTATETVENSVNNHIRELNIQQFPLILARALKWVVALCPLGTADYFFFAIASESYVYNTNFLSPALERARQVCCRRFADCLTRPLSLSLVSLLDSAHEICTIVEEILNMRARLHTCVVVEEWKKNHHTITKLDQKYLLSFSYKYFTCTRDDSWDKQRDEMSKALSSELTLGQTKNRP